MPRPQNPDLTKNWKICLPAVLAGTVEFYLFDSLHKKPKYGARGELLVKLLSAWVEEQKASPDARAKLIQKEIVDETFRLNRHLNCDELLTAINRALSRSLNEAKDTSHAAD